MAGRQLQTMVCWLLFLVMIHAKFPTSSSAASLKVGFYRWTCPDAEAIVKEAVVQAAAQDPGVAAGLIRMHFHDCFVRGCDASVLLDPTPETRVEKQSGANFPSLQGFEVIDEAKAILEYSCPCTVSCADILAFAARDASCVAGGIEYQVPAGRRDGTVSRESEIPGNLPPPFFTADKLVEIFAKKGLSADDMVTLAGAHSIGVSHCSSFSDRLYGFNATHPQDPSMDPAFADYLKARCPPPGVHGAADSTVPMDVATPGRLNNQYYRNLEKKRGLLTSDQTDLLWRCGWEYTLS
ncbi:hypothetical protein Taro_051510 [Colocasia esculenta]|uniref:Peroxidase n=1 Tax=Colocasia esculenta TaxID=4460 RepID=A0A843XGS0_COLES|nr:hypothetical protein [Colocasia esculenta]